jgi:hypothetical protein
MRSLDDPVLATIPNVVGTDRARINELRSCTMQERGDVSAASTVPSDYLLLSRRQSRVDNAVSIPKASDVSFV